MRVGLSTNVMSCQPLRNFGRADNLPKNNSSANNPAFTSTVSREKYDALMDKYNTLQKDYKVLDGRYDLACRFAATLDQYNEYIASQKSIKN